MQPGLTPFARAALGAPAQAAPRLTPAEMAALGRGGDTLVAHLTPGEITIPPQMQSPALIQAIQQAAAQVGADPRRMVAGSGQAPINPATGAEEHSFWSSLLPAVAMGATAFFAPELLPLLGMEGMGALGGGLLVGGAGALSSLATGASPVQALTTGAIGGATVGLGGVGSAASTLTNSSANAAVDLSADQAAQAAAHPVITGLTDASIAPTTTDVASTMAAHPVLAAGLGDTVAPTTFGQVFKTAAGALMGQQVGQYLDPSTGSTSSGTNPYAGEPTSIPYNANYGQLLGSNQTIRPNFNGYNPVQSVTQSGYQFYPQQSATDPTKPAVIAQNPVPTVL